MYSYTSALVGLSEQHPNKVRTVVYGFGMLPRGIVGEKELDKVGSRSGQFLPECASMFESGQSGIRLGGK